MAFHYNFPKIAVSSIHAQSMKILEEAYEVEAEVVALRLARLRGEKLDYKPLLVETIDGIQSQETMLQILLASGAVTQSLIDEAKAEVIRKNEERGYYEH